MDDGAAGVDLPQGAALEEVADVVGLRVTTFAAAVLMGVTLLVVRVVRPGFTAPIDEPVRIPGHSLSGEVAG